MPPNLRGEDRRSRPDEGRRGEAKRDEVGERVHLDAKLTAGVQFPGDGAVHFVDEHAQGDEPGGPVDLTGKRIRDRQKRERHPDTCDQVGRNGFEGEGIKKLHVGTSLGAAD